MSSVFGKNIKVSVFGQSHSAAIGVVIDGFPCGFEVNTQELEAYMTRRAPGSKLTTARKEADKVEFLSGITAGKTNGAPICAIIRNSDTRSNDYANIIDNPRPSHADFTAHVKYNGANDVAGGGHFSGRLTAPLCIAGGLCTQWLETKGVTVGAHISKIYDVKDEGFDAVNVNGRFLREVSSRPMAVINEEAGEKMLERIAQARANGDSVGGVVECAVTGLPVGVGTPMFDGVENRIAAGVFAIPGVKGIEFGNGYDCTDLYGSQNNDAFCIDEGKIKTKTNNSGGIQGGISNGMPVLFRVAFKPTPSIALPQETVSLSKNENEMLVIKGRHDPCIVLRAVVCVEAVAALTAADMLLDEMKG